MEIVKNINIYNDDFKNITKDFKDNSFDLIFTDPPYLTNMKRVHQSRHLKLRYNDSYRSKDARDTINLFFSESKRLLKSDGLLLIFMNYKRLLYFMYEAKMCDLWYYYFITWQKNNIKMNQYKTNPNHRCEYILAFKKERLTNPVYNKDMELYDIVNIDNVNGIDKNHPNEKPQELLLYFLKLYNFKKQKEYKVLDPFMGGGSLGRACFDFNQYLCNNIKYYGVEKEKNFFDNATELIKNNYRIKSIKQDRKTKTKTLMDYLLEEK